MYVCICHSVTDRQIREAANRGATRLAHLRRELGLGGTCGKCASCARQVLAEARAQKRDLPYLAAPIPALA